jgi:hypothetical protein
MAALKIAPRRRPCEQTALSGCQPLISSSTVLFSQGRELLLLRVQLVPNHGFDHVLQDVARDCLQHVRVHLG